MLVVDEGILEEIYYDAGSERVNKAKKMVEEKRINITKVTYENATNFEIRAKVRGNMDTYDTYIHIENGEIEEVSCTCPDHEKTYGSCKHIVATLMEFSQKEEYIRLFQGITAEEKDDMKIYKKYQKGNEKYKLFKQMINSFYYKEQEEVKKENQVILPQTVHIEPKMIYNSYTKIIKLEFKLGEKQLYKLKSLPEFYDHMLNKEFYSYGQKLAFVHEERAFAQENIPLLNYILKYAEIIKYANESTNEYTYYGRNMADSYITVSNSGLDEFFEVLKGQKIIFQKDMQEQKILFIDQEPDIQFKIEEKGKNECTISPSIDIYQYEVLQGREYCYFLYDQVLYRCHTHYKETILKLLQTFRTNFTTQIDFPKQELSQLFSIVFPQVKEAIKTDQLRKEEIEQFIPKELAVKLFLDYDESNYITADIRFVYGEKEFNPIAEEPQDLARNLVQENDVLEMFRKDKFMLDTKHARLILVQEDSIYTFLSERIEEYMQRFEVLATDHFKQKEIKQPQMGTLGVRIENNLLKVDFSQFDFDASELKEIMQKYQLKKKYHRLKDGTYLNLEENETMDFIESITNGLELDYKEVAKGEIALPMYRSLYLDRLLQTMKETNVQKDGDYKKIVDQLEEKDIVSDILPPNHLKADLRHYQRVGYQWLKVLDEYQFGGILADDMGLGKTIQLLAVVQSYIEKEETTKPSIVVCPSSLCLNWENEARKFTPEMKVLVIQGNAEERRQRIESCMQYHLVITSYDLLKRDLDIYKECDLSFKYIIADEAQYIKNNNTQNAKAIKEIKAETRYALTGTPIENSLSELWSIFDFIMPGYLFRYRKFKELYETPIIKDEDQASMKKLKMLIEPFILRRIKTEVLTELPDKTISILNNEMQEEQLKIYVSYMQNAKQEAMQEINTKGIEKSQIKILALLMRLRQICCHPSLFIENYKGESSKLNQCMELVKDAVEAGHKILLFSGYTAMFPFFEKELKQLQIPYFTLTGKTKVSERVQLVEAFNQSEEVKVFLISLKAGGTGLNLTGADMVIHYDPWWNLSAENQATDRTYRIGQKKNVQVYKLITKNSIEERIFELQEKKAKLIDTMLSTNQTFINKLSKQDIMELFK